MNGRKERNSALDLIRVVATVFMIKLHTRYDGFVSEIIHYMCGSAIPLFLMVSGAVTLACHDEVSKRYIFNRILRILKIIGIWALIFSIVEMIQTKELCNPVTLLLGSFVQKGWLSHFWYLWSLMVLYILAPFLKKLLTGNTKCFVVGGLLVICTIVYTSSLILGYFNGEIFENKLPQFSRLYIHITYFVIGAIIYSEREAFGNIDNNILGLITVLLWVTNAFLQCIISNRVFRLHSPEYSFSSIIQIIVNTSIFVAILNLKMKNRGNIIKRLSKYSFGAYIIHVLMIAIVNKISPYCFWALQYIIVLVLSYLGSAIANSVPIIKRTVEL